MPSLRARLVELALPLLGIKRFFSQPDRLDERIAKLRLRKSPRPRGKWQRLFAIGETSFQGFPVVTLTPNGGTTEGAPHLFYLHGGGYVMDIAAIHWEAIAYLCERLGASATVPIYPLAPEHKAGQTLPAMRALYDETAATQGARNITMMGDSAGAGMALALVQDLLASGAPVPSSVVLYSPWLDATASGEGQAAIEPKDQMLAIAGLETCAQRYAGGLPLEDPRLSPLFGPLGDLPPTAIFAGTHDILLVDARRFAEKLAGSGTDHLYREYDGMFHDWMLFPIPEGRQALDETVRFISGARVGEGS